MVGELIRREGGVLHGERHVQGPLHAWGFSLIRPGRRHIKRAGEEVDVFKKGEEAIGEAKGKGWNMLCGNGSIMAYDGLARALWARKGGKPAILTTGSHAGTHPFGALSIDGRQPSRRRDRMDGGNLLRFLKEVKGKFGSSLPLLDRYSPHRSRDVEEWLDENKDYMDLM